MQYLRQSTASQSVVIGPFVDDTDGTTAETGLTIANTDIRLSKNGGNIVAKNSGGGTHDELGFYAITLDATDTDTVGRLQLICKMSGALVVYHEFQVLEENVYDALVASAAGLGTNVAAILADTAEIGTAGAGLSAIPWNAAWDAEVESECADALAAYDPPTNAELEARTLTAANYASASALATVDSNVDAVLTDTGTAIPAQIAALNDISASDVWAAGTRTLTANTNLNDPTAAAIRAEVDANSTQLAAILEDTGTSLPALIAAIDGVVDAIKAETDKLDASHAEPSGVPAANESPLDKLGYLFMALRNGLEITATKKQFHDDAGNVEWEKDLSDDGTTYVESEANTP